MCLPAYIMRTIDMHLIKGNLLTYFTVSLGSVGLAETGFQNAHKATWLSAKRRKL